MTWHFHEKKIFKLTLRSDLFAAAPNLVPSPRLDLNIFGDRLKFLQNNSLYHTCFHSEFIEAFI